MNESARWPLPALAVLLAFAGLAPAADRTDPAALARTIDQAIAKPLATEKTAPAPLADDAEFLRRACLDITGVIPPADRAATFLDSKDPDKRARLIDELLASPQYGRHMADVWQALLAQRDPDNRRTQFEPLVRWLEDGFNGNKPWDKLVTELLTASGTPDKDGAVTFFLANPSPDKLTDRISRAFLGVRLQCAQCHNHPFTKWTQNDYWGMAAFFTRVRMDGNPRQAQAQATPPGISEDAKGGRPLRLPDSAKRVPAKFFLGDEPKLSRNEPVRPVLAAWLTAADNPYFARAMVNRTWAQFLGHGFVNPVDDVQPANPPSNPELFDELARQFAAGGYDLKGLIRAICTSDTYQRTSKRPAGTADEDPRLFARMAIKPLTPEQLYDSLEQVLGKAERPDRPRPAQGQAPRQGPANPRAAFVAFFQTDETADPTEYQAGVPQALRLMNSAPMNSGGTLLNQMRKSRDVPAQIIEGLYLAALSRRPTPEETQKLSAYVAKHDDARAAYGDILWALLNSSEFALNH